MRLFNVILCLCIVSAVFSQPGKDGVGIITASNQTVNKYSPVSVSIAASSNTVEVANINLLSICPGDLIMVYQAQGASMDISNTNSYGNILGYNSAGLYEFKYVQSVSGNIITTQTTFTNSYSVSGKTQVVKVPQYSTLTINSGASIVPKPWKDTTISSTAYRFGGIVVVHSANIVNNGTITATGFGFRGGIVKGATPFSFGPTDITSILSIRGAEKGEGVFGNQLDYDTNGGRYCMGAPANGGGGATSTNAGGGGGANGNNGNIWTGQGRMIVNANNPLTAWGLDPGFIANGNSLTNSSGGGRGGYSVGGANANPLIAGPGNSAWIYDNRREVGGRGGRPLININSETRIYFGGGGGAGDANNAAGTSGGNGGGIVYLICTTSISGSGTIESNGNSVGNTIGCNCDGSGGAGGGGSIVLKTGAVALTQGVSAKGGIGGTQLQVVSPGAYYESEGPGGGGGGGFIAISGGAIIPSVSGGFNGTTQTAALVQMTSNGATAGADGQIGTVTNSFISFTPIGSLSVTAGSNSPLCEGAVINLTTSSGATTYSWSGPSGFSSTLQNPSITNALPSMSGIYSVVLTFNSGCQSVLSGSINVLVNPLPVPVINCNTLICIGHALNLYGSGGLTYLWNGPNSFTSSLQNPTINNFSVSNSGVYTLTVTDTNGCSASVNSNSIIATSGPTIKVTGDTSCIGQPINLSAASSLPGSTYYWIGPNSFTSTVQNPPLGIASASLAGVYQLTVTYSGCSTITSVTLTINNNGVPPTITTNSFICTNGTLNLSTGPAQSYSWSGPNGFSSSLQNPTISVNSNLVAGVYSLTVVDMNNCISINTVNINVSLTPTINIVSGNNKGCPQFCTTFTCNASPSGAICNWNMGNGTSFSNSTIVTSCYNSRGIYTITAGASLNGCTSAANFTVEVFPKPTADFNYTPYQPIEMKDEVNFMDASFGAPIVSWNWYFMNTAQYTSLLQNPVFTYPDAGQFVVALVVKSNKGCLDTILKTIVVGKEFSLFVPNAFTPNDDGKNDTFYAKGYGILKFEMDIYDRWGENIFHTNDINNDWDGTYKSKEKCKDDIYVWKIKVWGCNEVVKELCGHVTLIK